MPPKKHNTLRVAKTGRVEVVQGTPSGPSQGADTPNKTKNKSKSKKKPKRAAVVEIDSPDISDQESDNTEGDLDIKESKIIRNLGMLLYMKL
jgi:hypothetical protein